MIDRKLYQVHIFYLSVPEKSEKPTISYAAVADGFNYGL